MHKRLAWPIFNSLVALGCLGMMSASYAQDIQATGGNLRSYAQADAQRALAAEMEQRLRAQSDRSDNRNLSIPNGLDVLDQSDAPTFRFGNGAQLRVSGGFVPATDAKCVTHCVRR